MKNVSYVKIISTDVNYNNQQNLKRLLNEQGNNMSIWNKQIRIKTHVQYIKSYKHTHPITGHPHGEVHQAAK